MLAAVLVLIYIVLIALLIIGFDRLPYFVAQKQEAQTAFTVIVPFRNEEKNLPSLLKSIQELNYPEHLVEFILVDDESTDASAAIIKSFGSSNLKSIQNKRVSASPKKDAISVAISEAKYPWIITTDADCILPKNWLVTFDQYLSKNECEMLVAPVTYESSQSFLNQFQLLDFLSLQGATIGGFGWKKPFLCNGANLVYKKKTFKQLNGFEGNNTMASGDDFFLMERFLNKDKKSVHYVKSKEVMVKTRAVDSISKLINQRVRWAAKSSNYNLLEAKIVGLIVLLGNLSLMALPFLSWQNLISWELSSLLFLGKCFIDAMLLHKTEKLMEQNTPVLSTFLSCFIYPIFSSFVALRATFGTYRWKDRVFKK